MNACDYLKFTRNTYSIFSKENHPTELSCIFKLYQDMADYNRANADQAADLILTQSPPGHTTEFITLPAPYIVLELQELQRISQAFEFFSFQTIDTKAPISYFHAMWIENYQKLEQTCYVPVDDQAPSRISVTITSSDKLKNRSPLLERSRSCELLRSMSELKSFEYAFEVVPTFLIAHELAHYEYEQNPDSALEKLSHTIDDLGERQGGGGHFLDLICIPSEYITKEFLVGANKELYCDMRAIEILYSICVVRHWMDERLLSLMLVKMFSAMFFI